MGLMVLSDDVDRIETRTVSCIVRRACSVQHLATPTVLL